jgi:alkanesulfonate monooxygenase SsuD/methylene tetrahydromethanopterin reductase-like flavin-dependent oxidoreductase (luciferase family)
LGLGAGWHTAEAEAYGLTLPENLGDRFDLFDEACEVIVGLLSGEATTVHGEWFDVTDAFCEPKGPQAPPPITIGGSGPKRTLRAVARFADWWNTPFWEPDRYPEMLETLAGHCEDLGRDPSEIRHSTHVVLENDASAAQIANQVGEVVAAGVDQPILYLQPPHPVSTVERAIEAIDTLDVDHT